jgi:hypothetical protein
VLWHLGSAYFRDDCTRAVDGGTWPRTRK